MNPRIDGNTADICSRTHIGGYKYMGILNITDFVLGNRRSSGNPPVGDPFADQADVIRQPNDPPKDPFADKADAAPPQPNPAPHAPAPIPNDQIIMINGEPNFEATVPSNYSLRWIVFTGDGGYKTYPYLVLYREAIMKAHSLSVGDADCMIKQQQEDGSLRYTAVYTDVEGIPVLNPEVSKGLTDAMLADHQQLMDDAKKAFSAPVASPQLSLENIRNMLNDMSDEDKLMFFKNISPEQLNAVRSILTDEEKQIYFKAVGARM